MSNCRLFVFEAAAVGFAIGAMIAGRFFSKHAALTVD
jgi:hypothetical protein